MADAPNVSTCVARYQKFRDLTSEYQIDFHRRRLGLLASRVREGERVLDVGCNGGYFVNYLPPSCEVHGIDPSEDAVEIAKTRLVSAQVGSAESLPFSDKSMDVVVLAYILERVFDPSQVLAEARRVARRIVIGDTPHENGPWGPSHVAAHPFDVRCFTEQSLRELLGPCRVDTVSWGAGPVMYSYEVVVE